MYLMVAASLSGGRSPGSSATCTRIIDDMTPVTRQQRRPNGAESKNLNVRVPPDVLARAHERAAGEGETLSAAVVRFLREYGEGSEVDAVAEG